jgi:glycerate kinase
MAGCKITVATDVQNTLTGKNGTLLYAKQKGARPEMIPIIRKALTTFRKVVFSQYGIDLDRIPGTGAAGGIGGAFMALLNAEIQSGFDLVSKLVTLDKSIQESDVVITGEGRVDRQTFFGKTAMRVIETCQQYAKPVILVTGSSSMGADKLKKHGVIKTYCLVDIAGTITKAIKNTPKTLLQLSYRIGKDMISGYQ